MIKKLALLAVAAACAQCVEWTRFSGTVKVINLKNNTLTLQEKNGDLLYVPIDYQIKILEKGDELRALKDLKLDDKVTLIKVQADAPAEDTAGLAAPETSQRGR
jgi:hypothetical protein